LSLSANRKRGLLLALVGMMLLPTVSLAQFPIKYKEKKIKNLPKYDRRMFHFGFVLGTNYTDLSVKNVENLAGLDSVYVVEPAGAVGFNLGIVSAICALANISIIRFIPGISFVGRGMNYTLIERDTVTTTYEKTVNPYFSKCRCTSNSDREELTIGGFI
jgi:hypothetical protein